MLRCTNQTPPALSRRLRQKARRRLGRLDERHPDDRHALGEGRQEARRQGPVEDREDAAVVGPAHEAPIGLAQPQAGDAVIVLRAAEHGLPRAVQDIRARPRHPVEHDEAQGAPGHIDPVAHRIAAEEARILLGAEDVYEGPGRHRVDMLGEQEEALRLEHRGDPLMHRAQPRDRGEKAERTALGGDHQGREGGRDLPQIVARNIGDDQDAGLRRIVEGRGNPRRARAVLKMAQTGRGLGGAPGELRVGLAVGQGRRGHHDAMRRLGHQLG